jgi:hypothetical protein
MPRLLPDRHRNATSTVFRHVISFFGGPSYDLDRRVHEGDGERSNDLGSGRGRPLEIIRGIAVDIWRRFRGVAVDLIWLPCLVVVFQAKQRSRYGPESHIPPVAF